ncbi:hypothetical protein BGZ81_007026 [Podila clonocystis]|nr:hypothetical protein BGZ81_007026 [Podila clonocystis]
MSMSLDDFDGTNGFEQGFGDHQCHQDMCDEDMDVDSNGSVGNDNDDTSKSSPFSRDSSTTSDVTGPSKLSSPSSRSPEPKETISRSNEMASHPKTQSKAKAKSNAKAKNTKSKSTQSSASTSTLGRPTKAARKQSGAEQLSPEAKRQRFLERNRLAAAKCREKKRLQTLKTITDADEITAKNQALHESLNELQEEVRMLKNQILCHRDCGCDVIQKFVKTSLTVPSSSSSSLQRKMSLGSPSFSPPYFHNG